MKYLNREGFSVGTGDTDRIFGIYYHHRLGRVRLIQKPIYKKGVIRNCVIQQIHEFNNYPLPDKEPIIVPFRALRLRRP
jgi:hypothetical protein